MRHRPEQFDAILDNLIQANPNMMVPWFLFASYLYYHRDVSLLTDERYDRLCKDLNKAWPKIEHAHKAVIPRESLEAGTGFVIPVEKYPTICTHAATHLAQIAWVDHTGVTKYVAPRKKSFVITSKAKRSGKVLVFGRKK